MKSHNVFEQFDLWKMIQLPITVLMCFLLLRTTILAQNISAISQDGLTFTLSLDRYVYAPNETMRVSYTMENDIHLGILLSFPDTRPRSVITIITPYGTTGNDTRGFLQVVTQEYIDMGQALSTNFDISLASFEVAQENSVTLSPVSVKAGDTLTVTSKPATSTFGIDMPDLESIATQKWEKAKDSVKGDERYDPQLDTNSDDVINFPDFIGMANNRYILDWNTIPELATRSIQVIIRDKSADFNRDGIFDLSDFMSFVDAFGSKFSETKYNANLDLDGDGQINFNDFLIFVELFKKQE